MELDRSLDELKKKGLGLAAISYDSVGILKNFSERRHIRYPLLADADSKFIRAVGILNESAKAGTMFYGIPHPVTFIVNPKGIIEHKYFEDDYRERQTLSGILIKDFGLNPTAARENPKAKHITLESLASTGIIRPGQKILLAIDLDIPQGFHLYAPGVEGYHAVDWTMSESAVAKPLAVAFPKSRILYLKAIEEKVPVFEGKIRLTRDITIAADKAVRAAAKDSKVTLEGGLKYQACNERLCYPPETVKVTWTFDLEAHDSERVPAELRHK